VRREGHFSSYQRGELMPADKIAITLDRELVKEIDRGVKSGLYPNRSRAIEEAVRKSLNGAGVVA
jgi:metal-responsive CopG/Arc/MetJ family transcriptional regulator